MTFLYLHSLRLPYSTLKGVAWEMLKEGCHLTHLGKFYEHNHETSGFVYKKGDLEEWVRRFESDPSGAVEMETPKNWVEKLREMNVPLPPFTASLLVFPLSHPRNLSKDQKEVIGERYSLYQAYRLKPSAKGIIAKLN